MKIVIKKFLLSFYIVVAHNIVKEFVHFFLTEQRWIKFYYNVHFHFFQKEF